jgi:hypothetical protein
LAFEEPLAEAPGRLQGVGVGVQKVIDVAPDSFGDHGPFGVTRSESWAEYCQN